MTSDIRTLIPSPTGEFNVDRSCTIVVQCTDKHLGIPKDAAAKCPFITAPSSDDAVTEFEFAATVLENLVGWTLQYGVKGVAASPIVRPCLYRDYTYVLTDEWDNEFYHSHLCKALNQKHYLATMTAAEKFGLTGLLDFMAVGLGCKLRNEDDNTIIHEIMGIDKETEVTEEDIAKVDKDYPWFADITKPVDVK